MSDEGKKISLMNLEGNTYGLIFYKLCISLFLFCLTFIFGFLPTRLFIGTANAFSGGIFFSISLMHLLPESSILFHEYFHDSKAEKNSEHDPHFPISYFLAFCGYTLILLIEKIIFDSFSYEDKNESLKNTSDIENNANNSPLSNSNFHPQSINTDNVNLNLERYRSKERSGKSSRTELFKFYNINNNYNITIKDIKEEKSGVPENKLNGHNESDRFNLCSDVIINQKSKSITKLNRKKRESITKSGLLNAYYGNRQDQITNMDEYLNEINNDDEMRNEKKFKKLFTMKGKFSSLAKEKFQKFKGLKSDNHQTTPITDLKRKIYRELFEETRPSISDKDQLLIKEETKLFNKRNITSFLLLLALSIHAFFEGLALGLIDTDREIFFIFIAISFHKWVEALSIGINLNKSKIDRDVLMVLITLFSLTTPCGIILGIVLSGISSIFEAVFLSISAGTFLYISASEVIVEEFSVGGHKILKFCGFLLGSLMIALFTVFEYVKF